MKLRLGKWLGDPLFLGIVSLQCAVFGLVGNNTRGDSLSAIQLQSVFVTPTLAVGRKLPGLAVYEATGLRRSSLPIKRNTFIVFKTDCTCDVVAVRSQSQAALQRGEDAITIIQIAPEKLNGFQKKNELPGRTYSIRREELGRLGLAFQLPALVHVDANGLVQSVKADF